MKTYIVKRTGQAPLRVRGEVLASVVSSPDRANIYWSGRVGRYTGITIYRTTKGKYVAAISHHTLWQGETDVDDAAVFPSLAEAIEWLSYHAPRRELGWLIDQLPAEDIAEEVE
jgi:hypothetical protein